MAVLYRIGEEDSRPWGHWIVVDVGKRHAVKRITVKSGARLSLQYHRGRDEVWTCIQGSGVATIDGNEVPLVSNGSVFVPKMAHHRMANTGKEDLIIIETQLGETLDEDDIIRVEDDFGRG
ncbi:MAG: phosphomannose isomerase type II C-terminal cupin domain [Pseudomonadota bacterium]